MTAVADQFTLPLANTILSKATREALRERNHQHQDEPRFWLHVTEAELHSILAADPSESVKLQCYQVSEEAAEVEEVGRAARSEPLP